MARTEKIGRCSATNAYFTLHPWRNTRPLFRMSRSSVTRVSSRFSRRISLDYPSSPELAADFENVFRHS